MKELSIFIDESGDFGPFEPHSPFYIITLVFHYQQHDISDQIVHLRNHIVEQGFDSNHAIHTAPLIRRESDYKSLDMASRRKLFRSLFTFVRLCDINYKSFLFKKREFSDHDSMVTRMAREIGGFVRLNLGQFQTYDRIIVYYDNGQKEISNIINAVFNVLLEADIRKVTPSDYSLFQAADMLCTLELAKAKTESVGLSKSEDAFFGSVRYLKKNYLKPISKKSL